MASPHSAVVSHVDDAGHPARDEHPSGRPSASSTPRPSNVDARSRELLAPPSALHSPVRTHSPDSWLGYESPNEESTPAFFSENNQQTLNEIKRTRSQQDPISASGPVRRPNLISRPSHMVAVPPPNRRANTGSSLNDMLSGAEKPRPGAKVGIKDRIACYQWTWFTMTMATGGIANILYSLRYRASWLLGIGLFFFILNICLFIMNCLLISYRFYLRPGSFKASFTDQVESLFIPSFFVSIAIIMINICEYGVPSVGVWLLRTLEIMFWIYVALSTFASAGIYLILWSTLVFPVHMMTPTWVFPAYPLLLTAPFAGQLIVAAERSPDEGLVINKTAVALCAVTTQGTGCLIAFMISAAFIYRLMTQKLPRDMQRPGVFISIGPFGFTAAGIAQIGSKAHTVIPPNFLGSPHTADIVKVVSVLVALWLWGLSMWWFLVSVGSLWKYVRSGHTMPFQMTWWSFVFPNTALVTATEVMGEIFESEGIRIFGSVMTAMLIVVWIGVFLTMLWSLKQKKLLWPKDST